LADFSAFINRACPAWFQRPQLGVFIHWGLYAVPAWAPTGRSIHELMREDYDKATVLGPYAEWYANAMTVEGSPTQRYHCSTFGDVPYQGFRETFETQAEAFDAKQWVETFVAAGASYVVFVTKHHDGYCLWPTDVANPHRPNWASKRDFVGELAQATCAAGLKFGIYYSGGLDWTFYHPPISNMGEMLASVPFQQDYRDYASAQLKELIDRYQPSVLWNDIAWPDKADVPELFDYYYSKVPDGVVNDRWLGETRLFASLRTPEGLDTFNARMKATLAADGGSLAMSAPPHCDFRTVEYGLGQVPEGKKWEACRGVGLSFGYCAHEGQEHHLDYAELTDLKRSVMAHGGNMLINIGPRADGSIPQLQRNALIKPD
jgi:alpha-L-fucosidase